MLGHIALSLVPGVEGVGIGLVLIALGSGGVKANATSLVGSLYAADDERRDAGFSIFYMGINIGALVGPLLTGLLQKDYGFHYGFGLAAVGMFFGLVQYSLGRKSLPDETNHVPNPLPAPARWRYAVGAVVVLAPVAILVVTDVITADRLADIVVVVTIVAARAYFAVILSSREITDGSAAGSGRSCRCS
ncbi:MAG: proton-dependent oligopeptide transporter, family [Nocardioides sp.]|nr:proton-dependent oligopeptide transporter, family [Nocardioides sp.]